MRLARPLALAALLLLADAAPATAQRIRLLLEGPPVPHHVPILTAVAGGHFAREGLDPSVEAGLGSNMATVMVGQRAFDLAHVSAPVAAAAISRGSPIRVVAIYQPRTAMALVGLKGEVRLDSARAVEGLRVGVAPATTDGLALALFRRAQGMGISAMTLIPTERAEKLPDLLAGRFDVVVGDGPAMRAALLAQGQAPEVMELAAQGVALQGFGFIASEAMLDENPELLRRGLRALRAGFAAAVADPAGACAAVRAQHGLAETDAACTAALRVFLESIAAPAEADWGRQSPEAWLRMIEAMRAAGEVQGSRPPSFYFTNAVIP
jgi:NitT/TauT family transport system substrate-binding protein